MLIQNFMDTQLPFPFFLPSSLLLFLLPLFPHLPATAKETVGALKLLGGSGRSLAAERHFSEFWECFW